MLPKFLKKQSGMGLVEVMVAASILGGLSLVVMKLNENGIQGVTRTEKGMEIVEFDAEINSYLASKEGCTNSVLNTGTPTLASFDSSTEKYPFTVIKDKNNTTRFTVNDKRRNVTFKSAYLTAYNVSSGTPNFGPGPGNAFLVKTYEFNLAPSKTLTKTKVATVAITAAGANFAECIIKATKSDSVWTVDTYGIYYNNKTVAIGKNASFSLPHVLDVQGQAVIGYGSSITAQPVSNYVNSIFNSHQSYIDGSNSEGMTLLGGINNGVDDGQYGLIAGGSDNLVAAPGASIIIGGDSNIITGALAEGGIYGSGASLISASSRSSALTNIFGGYLNSILEQPFGTIVGGKSNVISGSTGSFNSIFGSVSSANIGGTGFNNTIVGGTNHTLSGGSYSVIIGGDANVIANGTFNSFIAGGWWNTVALNPYGSMSGGQFVSGVRNKVSTIYDYILGGHDNITAATAENAGVVGGLFNSTTGNYSIVIAGAYNVASGASSSVLGSWQSTSGIDRGAVIGGLANTMIGGAGYADSAILAGTYNKVSAGVGAIIAGDQNYLNGPGGAIIGGWRNSITSSSLGYRSAIIGGEVNHIAEGTVSVILGGTSNYIGAAVPTYTYRGAIIAGSYNAIKGGLANGIVSGQYNTIGGGDNLTILGGIYNSITAFHSGILGGVLNQIVGGGLSTNTSIIAGYNNYIDSSSQSVLLAGQSNRITTSARSIIAGGIYNTIANTAESSGIFAGQGNKLDGGALAGAWNAIIGGTANNIETNTTRSVIIGGNTDTVSSGVKGAIVIGGPYLKAAHNYSVLMGGMDPAVVSGFTTTMAGQFRARFTGGYDFCTTSTCSEYSRLVPGVVGWTSVSDRNAKENFTPINIDLILENILNLDITTWSYKKSNLKSKNIGPVAQDFYQYFSKPLNLSSSNKEINSNDLIGVSLAGVKALAIKNKKLEAKNVELSTKVKDLELELNRLKIQVDTILKDKR